MANPTPQIIKLFLNHTTFPNLEEEVKQGKFEKLKGLITTLSNEKIQHPFIQQYPDLCSRTVVLMEPWLMKHPESKDLIRKTLNYFSQFTIFTHLEGNVVLHCKDNRDVSANRSLLLLSSDKFQAQFAGSTKDSKKESDDKYHIDYTQFEPQAVELFLEYLYKKNQVSHDNIEIVCDLYQIAQMSGLKELEKICYNQFLNKFSKVQTDDQLDILLKNIEKIVLDDQTKTKFQFSALQSYLDNCEIKYRVSEEKSNICLDIKSLGIISQEGFQFRFIRNFVNGIFIREESDQELIELLLFMPDEERQRIRELIFFANLSKENECLEKLAVFFPHITHIDISIQLQGKFSRQLNIEPKDRFRGDEVFISKQEITALFLQMQKELKTKFKELETITIDPHFYGRKEGCFQTKFEEEPRLLETPVFKLSKESCVFNVGRIPNFQEWFDYFRKFPALNNFKFSFNTLEAARIVWHSFYMEMK